MKIQRIRRSGARCAALLLAAAMAVTTAWYAESDSSREVYAASFDDISGHWAESYIEKAIDYGFVNGYEDGTFKPDAPITRAEFTTMFNGALENKAEADIDFTDVTEDDWFYEDISRGVAASFINGYSDTEFAPGRNITRQEAAVMISRIVPSAGENATLKVFGDYGDVAVWAEDAFSRIVAKGYIGGYDDGNLHPGDNLTRAQAAKLMTDIIESENIISRNQTVVLPGVTLRDTIYTNQISVGEDVEDGDVMISNCVILGTLNVEGGGTEDNGGGVTIRDSRVSKAVVHRNSQPVSVRAEGETTLLDTELTEEPYLSEGNLELSGDFGRGFVSVSAGRAAYASLAGDFSSVIISGSKVDLALESGTIDNLSAESYATKTNIFLLSGTTVNTADIRAEGFVFEGEGAIRQLNANADGITYETVPENITVASGVTEMPKQVIIERVTPLLKSLAVRFFDGSGEASYTNLPVSASAFNYYIPADSTELTLHFRAVDDAAAAGYVDNPVYTVRYNGISQAVDMQNGTAVCEIPVRAGTDSQTVTVSVGSDNRDYGTKNYTITLHRISGEIAGVRCGADDISGYLADSRTEAEAWPYVTNSTSAAVTVSLSELRNADFVSYSIYRITESGEQLVAEGISGGNTVTLDSGYTYRIVTSCRCYSDSYAGCRTVEGETAWLSLH